MAEYITKESAIEAFEWGDTDVVEDYGDGCIFGFSRESIKSVINDIPAADVARVVHGQWENGNPICPVCGEDKFKDLDADIWADWEPPYCPNCGAKMDLMYKGDNNAIN